jgi:hypothetical protein
MSTGPKPTVHSRGLLGKYGVGMRNSVRRHSPSSPPSHLLQLHRDSVRSPPLRRLGSWRGLLTDPKSDPFDSTGRGIVDPSRRRSTARGRRPRNSRKSQPSWPLNTSAVHPRTRTRSPRPPGFSQQVLCRKRLEEWTLDTHRLFLFYRQTSTLNGRQIFAEYSLRSVFERRQAP